MTFMELLFVLLIFYFCEENINGTITKRQKKLQQHDAHLRQRRYLKGNAAIVTLEASGKSRCEQGSIKYKDFFPTSFKYSKYHSLGQNMLIFDKCEKIHRLFDKINANLVLSSNVFQTRKTVSYADVVKRLRGYFEYTFSIREGMDRKFQFEE